ncbi:MAG: 2Fe-2S iron-sulfur cluster-binding protein [Gammaproteobacteria bacterium]
MAQAIPITLDGKGVGRTLVKWEVAARHGLQLPNLYLSREPDFHQEGNCRLCMVEVEGRPHLQASCVTIPDADHWPHNLSVYHRAVGKPGQLTAPPRRLVVATSTLFR